MTSRLTHSPKGRLAITKLREGIARLFHEGKTDSQISAELNIRGQFPNDSVRYHRCSMGLKRTATHMPITDRECAQVKALCEANQAITDFEIGCALNIETHRAERIRRKFDIDSSRPGRRRRQLDWAVFLAGRAFEDAKVPKEAMLRSGPPPAHVYRQSAMASL